MRFLKAIWRFLMGVKDALALVALLLFFGGLFLLLSSGGHGPIPSGGALFLDLNGSLAEEPADARPLDLVQGAGGSEHSQYRLRDMIRGLNAAASDGRVKAVALDLSGFSGGGQAAVAQVGAALDRVRAAGKPVLAFSPSYDDAGYLLASHASEVWIDGQGYVGTGGPGGSMLYYKGLMDRLGVTAHVYRVGKYKSAVEPFTRTEASPEAKEEEQALVDAIWSGWQRMVTQARPQAKVGPYLARYTSGQLPNTTLAETARAYGLVDRIGDRLAFGRRIAEIVGPADSSAKGATGPGSFKTIDYDDWIAANPAPTKGAAIGVVTVAGDIVDGKAPAGTAGGDSIAEAITKALGKGDLKALVVRIDSPGGATGASDRIRSALMAAKAKGLPVVVSMGTVAASGGYYIATAGDTIFADPSTITGSIGVFAVLPTVEGSLGKIGLSADGVRATPLSGQPDMLRGTTPQLDAVLQGAINQFYAHFTGLVAAARHMPVQQVDAIAQGRVWDGVAARKIGLVDRFGTLDDALAEAARRAGLDPKAVHPVYVERESSTPIKLLKMLTGDASASERAGGPRDPFASLSQSPDLILARALGDARRILAGPVMQMRCLSCGAEPPAPQDVAAARALMAKAAVAP